MQQKTINVLLIEDNPDDAHLVQLEVDELPDTRLQTVDRLSSAKEILQSGKFDVVLMDLNLPDSVGLEGLINLRRLHQQLPMVIFTSVDDERLGIMALQRGAQDYLIKGLDGARISRAIRFAIERMKLQTAEGLNSEMGAGQNETSPLAGKPGILTERELQVLKLMGKGCTNEEITEELSIALSTVKTHISSILNKLSSTDRTKAVVEALRRGLI